MSSHRDSFQLSKTTQHAVGFDRLWAQIHDHCLTSYGKEIIESNPFLNSVEAIETRMVEVLAAKEWLREASPVLLGSIEEIRDFLDTAKKAEILSSADLKEVAQTLLLLSRIQPALKAGQASATLMALASPIHDWHDFALDIVRCFDEHGNLLSTASPELKQARDHAYELQEKMRQKMARLIEELDEQGVLQEPYFTLRNERYVLPIRSGAMGQIEGIVHDTSQTGHTLFVEPSSHLNLGNKIAVALGEVKVEENKLLKILTQTILSRIDEIYMDLLCVGRLDATFAQGKMALALNSFKPVVKAQPRHSSLLLKDARHPHLILSAVHDSTLENVIPNTLSFSGATGLVLSGPNAGGKTVVLKMVGLMIAMVRAGMPIPAAPESEVPLFDGVIAMVGDGQNIEAALSTFSAEANSLKEVIASVTKFKDHQSVLVLLDELFAGTDAQEGGALARAALEYLSDAGASLVVTTHLEAVKRMATESEESAGAFKSMFMAYDPDTNQPTFRLQTDGTGQSHAIQTAGNLGMPKRILQKALMYFHGITAPQERNFTSLLEEKDALLKTLDDKKEELRQARQKEQQLKEQLHEQKRVTQSWKSQHADLMDEELMKVQRMISKAIAAVQAKAGPRILDEVNHQLKTEIKSRQKSKLLPDVAEVVLPKIGDTVRLKAHPGQAFTVERLSHDDVWLQGDVLKMRVKLHEIEKRSYAAKEPRQSEVKVDLAKKDIFDTILDVRGQRVADALEAVQGFVDHCAAAGIGPIYIRHGHGTGALKKAIRSWLKQSSYKVQASTGPQALGGDGTTQVDF